MSRPTGASSAARGRPSCLGSADRAKKTSSSSGYGTNYLRVEKNFELRHRIEMQPDLPLTSAEKRIRRGTLLQLYFAALLWSLSMFARERRYTLSVSFLWSAGNIAGEIAFMPPVDKILTGPLGCSCHVIRGTPVRTPRRAWFGFRYLPMIFPMAFSGKISRRKSKLSP